MNTIAEHKLITLNTRYANKNNGTYNSDVVFNFRGILIDEEDIISSNICIMNAQLPVSFYTINETNNYIRINIGTGYEDVFIPFGNYNANTFFTAINTAWTATPNGTGNPLIITLNSANGKITFSYSSTLNINFPLNITSSQINYSYRIFGFNSNSTYTGLSIVAPYPLNLLGVNRLAVRSSRLAISSYNSVSLNLGITLATIPVDSPSFSLINYSNQTDLNKSLLLVKVINEIDILIVDEDNNPINFNNIDWTITLVLENIRKIPDKFTNSFNSVIQNIEMVKKENEDLAKEEKKRNK
jgi:hypothetical protein